MIHTRFKKFINSRNRITKIILSLLVIIPVIFITITLLLQLAHMALPWWRTTEIVNNSGENVFITPVSSYDGGKTYSYVWSLWTPWFFQYAERTNILVTKGQSFDIKYDTDDETLRLLLIQFPDGERKVIPLDYSLKSEYPGFDCSDRPRRTTYCILERNNLPDTPDSLVPLYDGVIIKFEEENISSLVELGLIYY